jgi:YbbR domain-containing protein
MLRQNLRYKILALLLAVALWFYVIITQRNALETQAFTVPVEMRHLSAKLIASVDPPRVRLFLRGTPQALESLVPLPAAYVSTADITPGTHTVEVAFVAPADVRVTRIVPQTVRVTVEPIVTKAMPIEPNIVGTAPSGYILGEPEVAPAQASASGVRSAVARVRHIVVNVDASYIRLDTPQTNELRAVDNDGAPVTGVDLSPTRARVTIPVQRMLSYQAVPVVLRTVGQPAAGYRIVRASVSPELVTVAGEAQRLRDVSCVPTVPVNIEDADTDIHRRAAPLSLPQGIISVSDSQVEVNITIQPQTD